MGFAMEKQKRETRETRQTSGADPKNIIFTGVEFKVNCKLTIRFHSEVRITRGYLKTSTALVCIS